MVVLNCWRHACGVVALTMLTACGRTGLAELPVLDASFDVAADIETDVAIDVPVEVEDDITPDEIDVPPDVIADPVCGNEVLEEGEECDEGELNSDVIADSCRTTCVFASCGDAVVDTDEECDDGNDEDFDLCSACRISLGQCAPCNDEGTCGRQVDHCAPVLEGQACLTGCRTAEDCPENSACQQFAGLPNLVCVPVFETCAGCLDRDNDGYGIGLECLGPDCNDADPNVNPAATEVCDDIDNDCDVQNDEGCPPDLLVRPGQDVTLAASDALYDRVQVFRGGTLFIEPYEGEPGAPEPGNVAGCFRLNARIIVVEQGGTISGDGAGGAGEGTALDTGFGRGLTNTGPGGGGYGGIGGSGPDIRAGGRAYGTESGDDIDQGSNGGGFSIVDSGIGDACNELVGIVTEGGTGGGCIDFTASTEVRVLGRITMDGQAGEDAITGSTPGPVDAGGGGSGGGILLRGSSIFIDAAARLSAAGGRGGRGGTYSARGGGGADDQCIGNGGGGGGGGRIKLFSPNTRVSGETNVAGGTGGPGPQAAGSSGARGSLHAP